MSYHVLSFSGRHTLWRCLQSTVTPILARILEVMDRYANMDLLSDERLSQGLKKLWLDILADPQILELPSAQNTRYCKNISCIIPATANVINVFQLLYFVVSQTKKCLCNTTSSSMVKDSVVLPHSVGSSECILKAFGKNQSSCQVCLGPTEFLVTQYMNS